MWHSNDSERKSVTFIKQLINKPAIFMVISRLRKVPWFPECSLLSSNSSGYISPYTFPKRSPSLRAHRSSMNRFVEWKCRALTLSLSIKFLMYLCSYWYRNRFAQKGAGSIPIGMPITWHIKTLPTLKKTIFNKMFNCLFQRASWEYHRWFWFFLWPICISKFGNYNIWTTTVVIYKINYFRKFFQKFVIGSFV